MGKGNILGCAGQGQDGGQVAEASLPPNPSLSPVLSCQHCQRPGPRACDPCEATRAFSGPHFLTSTPLPSAAHIQAILKLYLGSECKALAASVVASLRDSRGCTSGADLCGAFPTSVSADPTLCSQHQLPRTRAPGRLPGRGGFSPALVGTGMGTQCCTMDGPGPSPVPGQRGVGAVVPPHSQVHDRSDSLSRLLNDKPRAASRWPVWCREG